MRPVGYEHLRQSLSLAALAPAKPATRIESGDTFLRGPADDSLYRHRDATACVEFGYRMAEQAREVEPRQETAFLARRDAIVRTVGKRFDLRGSDPATLVPSALDNGGKVSIHRRRQFQNRVPEGVFDAVQDAAARFAAQG